MVKLGESDSGYMVNSDKWSFWIYTACGHRMAHRKWKENKLKPGTAGPKVSPIRKDVSNVPKFGTFGTFEMSFQSV